MTCQIVCSGWQMLCGRLRRIHIRRYALIRHVPDVLDCARLEHQMYLEIIADEAGYSLRTEDLPVAEERAPERIGRMTV